MEIKELITKAVQAITENDALRRQFAAEPVKALEKILGMDLPDDLVDKLIDGINAKLTADDIAGIAGKLKGLF